MRYSLVLLSFLYLMFGLCMSPAKAGTPLVNDQLTVTISPVTDAHICGTSLVTVSFTNNGPLVLILPKIDVDLDNHPDDLVTLKGVVGSPNFNLQSGLGTSNPAFNYRTPIAVNETVTLTLEVQYSCALFDLPANRAGCFIQATGFGEENLPVPPPYSPIPQPFDVQTPDYGIETAEIVPEVNLSLIQATYNDPFDIIVPLNIGGKFCDPDFTLLLRSELPCLDFSFAQFKLKTGGVEYPVQGSVTSVDKGVNVTCNLTAMGLAAFCEANYPGGLEEVEIIIENLVIGCGCGTPDNVYPIEIGFTPCTDDESPEDCKVDGHVQPQTTTVQDVYLKPFPNPELEFSDDSTQNFSICSTFNTQLLQLTNTGEGDAYSIDLQFSNQMGYAIFQVRINGILYPVTAGHVDLSTNTNPGLGFQDLNGDGIYAELSLGAPAVNLQITYRTGDTNHCGVGSSTTCEDPCEITTLNNPLLEAKVTWNNECNSMPPTPTAVLQYAPKLPNVALNVKTDFVKIPSENSGPYPIHLELKGGALEGFDGYMDQGAIHQFLCIKDFPNTISYDGVSINNGPLIPVVNGFVDLGIVAAGDIGNMLIDVQFYLGACPIEKLVTFEFKFGIYFANCPSCLITLACGDANFLSPCSGGGECTGFTSVDFDVYNDIYAPLSGPVPDPAKVYPCDCLNIDFTVVTGDKKTPGDQLMLGFLVSDEFANSNYFNLPITVNGMVSFTPPGGNATNLPFGSSVINNIPGEPYAVIYCQSAMTNGSIPPGSIITGSFKVCMASGFASSFDKIDFFTPVVGVNDGSGGLEFCFSGYTDLYALEPSYTIEEEVSATCANGGLFTASLIKTGGELYGPDFPDFPRVTAQIGGNVIFAVDNGNPDYHIIPNNGLCMELPNPYVFSAVNLVQPSGLEASGAVIQSFELGYEENCAGNVPVRVVYDVLVRPGDNAPCAQTEQHSAQFSETGADFPHINTHFSPPATTLYLSDNLSMLEITTQNTGGDGDEIWVQVEYNPALLEIDPAQVTGPYTSDPFEIDGPGGSKVLIIPLDDLSNAHAILINGLPIHLLEGSCSSEPTLRIYGLHRCGCSDEPVTYTCAANYTDIAICVDSERSIKLIPLDANLNLTPIVCHKPGEICDVFTVSVILENTELGNLSNVVASLDLPAGLELTKAFYDIGTMSENCDTTTNQIEITEITGTGWLVSDGILEGTLSPLNDDDRRVRLYLSFKGCGINLDADFKITVTGIKPCGTVVEKNHIFEDIYSDIQPLSGDLVLNHVAPITYDNQTGAGSVTLRVTAATWGNFVDGKITLTSSNPNIIFNPAVILLNNPPANFPFLINVSFVNQSLSCSFDINVLAEVCTVAECSGDSMSCEFCKTTDAFTLNYTSGVSGNLIVPYNLPCVAPAGMNATVTARLVLPSSGTGGNPSFNYATIFCDANSNGIVDQGEAVLFSQVYGSFSAVPGQPGTYFYNFNIPTAALVSCAPNQIILTFGQVYALEQLICVNPMIANICCDCGIEKAGERNENFEENLTLTSEHAALDVSVFPNPGPGLYTLKALSTISGEAKIRISDQLGNQVYTTQLLLNADQATMSTIDLSALPSGVYFLSLHTDTAVTQQVLVKI